MTFPQIVSELSEGGFEGYSIDLRRGTAIYYLPDGDSIELMVRVPETKVAQALDVSAVQGAIREAQLQVPGYTYNGFCNKLLRQDARVTSSRFWAKELCILGALKSITSKGCLE